jgi:hypothetical protein
LQPGEVDVEVVGDRGQRDVDERAVEEGDRRAEDGPGDEPPALRGAAADPARRLLGGGQG